MHEVSLIGRRFPNWLHFAPNAISFAGASSSVSFSSSTAAAAAAGRKFVEGDVEWNTRSTVIYPVLCILAGFFAGLFGVGGGIIKGPLMLEMGVLPPVAAANAATMILFTTGIAALTFLLFGAIDPPVRLYCLQALA